MYLDSMFVPLCSFVKPAVCVRMSVCVHVCLCVCVWKSHAGLQMFGHKEKHFKRGETLLSLSPPLPSPRNYSPSPFITLYCASPLFLSHYPFLTVLFLSLFPSPSLLYPYLLLFLTLSSPHPIPIYSTPPPLHTHHPPRPWTLPHTEGLSEGKTCHLPPCNQQPGTGVGSGRGLEVETRWRFPVIFHPVSHYKQVEWSGLG